MNPQPTNKVTQMPAPEAMQAFMMCPDDWFASQKVACMDDHEQIAYFRLLMRESGDPTCTLPDSDFELANLSGLGGQWRRPTRDRNKRSEVFDSTINARRFKTSGEKIRECFSRIVSENEHLGIGRLYNARLYKDYLRFQEIKSSNRSRAKAGARAKWGQNGDACSISQASENDQISMLDDAHLPPFSSPVEPSVNLGVPPPQTSAHEGGGGGTPPVEIPEQPEPERSSPVELTPQLTDAEYLAFKVHCADPTNGPSLSVPSRKLARELRDKFQGVFPNLPKYPNQKSPGLWSHDGIDLPALHSEGGRQSVISQIPANRKPSRSEQVREEFMRNFRAKQKTGQA